MDASVAHKEKTYWKRFDRSQSRESASIYVFLSRESEYDLRFDHLIIESTGISDPFPVAETFIFETNDGETVDDIAELDTMVTVVDTYNFLRDFKEGEDLERRNMSWEQHQERTVTDVLVSQVEFANLIILNKIDLVRL
jgi:G3E family GTPase